MHDNPEQLNGPNDPLEQIPTLDRATIGFSLDIIAGVVMGENRRKAEHNQAVSDGALDRT